MCSAYVLTSLSKHEKDLIAFLSIPVPVPVGDDRWGLMPRRVPFPYLSVHVTIMRKIKQLSNFRKLES
jgi:hypothetical protein